MLDISLHNKVSNSVLFCMNNIYFKLSLDTSLTKYEMY